MVVIDALAVAHKCAALFVRRAIGTCVWAQVCGITCCGLVNFEQHCSSKKHLRRAAAAAGGGMASDSTDNERNTTYVGLQAQCRNYCKQVPPRHVDPQQCPSSLAEPFLPLQCCFETSSLQCCTFQRECATLSTGIGIRSVLVVQVISTELNRAVVELLQQLLFWQERAKATSPYNVTKRKRLVSGLRYAPPVAPHHLCVSDSLNARRSCWHTSWPACLCHPEFTGFFWPLACVSPTHTQPAISLHQPGHGHVKAVWSVQLPG